MFAWMLAHVKVFQVARGVCPSFKRPPSMVEVLGLCMHLRGLLACTDALLVGLAQLEAFTCQG